MTSSTPAQRAASRRLLAPAVGVARTTAHWIDASERLHERLRLGLTPLIGGRGFDALFDRSLHITATDLGGVVPVAKLGDYLGRQEPTVAAEMAVAVFATFFALLTNFIGEALTDKILVQVGLTVAPNRKENDQ